MLWEPAGDDDGSSVSRVVDLESACTQIVPSWNIVAPRGGGFAVLLRVRRQDGVWSGWRVMGLWGTARVPATPAADAWPEVAVDTLRSDRPLVAAQYALLSSPDSAEPARVDRFALCCTALAEDDGPSTAARLPLRPVRLEVPFRSQFSDASGVGSRLCSPTCVAMVLSYYAAAPPFGEIAAACYDPRHDLFGNWSRAVQAAFGFGVRGYVTRFHDLEEAWGVLRSGRPIVASIAFTDGALPGAPLGHTDGHLVVVCGVTTDGDLLVNDPAAPPGAGTRVYPGEPFAAAWFGHRGTAYVFDPPAAGPIACAPP